MSEHLGIVQRGALCALGLLAARWGYLRLREHLAGARKGTLSLGTAPLPRRTRAEWDALVPEGVQWISGAGLQSLSAVLDTLFPAFTAAPPHRVVKAMSEEVADLVHVEGDAGAVDAAKVVKALELDKLCRNDKFLDFLGLCASDTGTALHFCEAIEAYAPSGQRRELGLVLWLLSTGAGTELLSGFAGLRFLPFHHLPFAERHAILRAWSLSPLAPLRQLFQAIKRLGGSLFLGAPVAGAKSLVNPSWDMLRYKPRALQEQAQAAGALHGAETERIFASASAPSGDSLDCDAVIVGSGAGGAVAAAVLCEAGLRVVVVEKGGMYSERDFAEWTEKQAFEHAYDAAGLVATQDAGVSILAGSCVGGGTTVNWSASFRTPERVRSEWRRRFGLDAFAFREKAPGDFDRALSIVCERCSVNERESHRHAGIFSSRDGDAPEATGRAASHAVNRNNDLLVEGAAAIGAKCRTVPRNVKGCVDCGSCNAGCVYGAKQGALRTFLRDAMATGRLTLLCNTEVVEVLREKKCGEASREGTAAQSAQRACGVLCRRKAETWQRRGAAAPEAAPEAEGPRGAPFRVNARAVVLSAGSLHTPSILLRSGFAHPKIGRHLSLHPVAVVAGCFPSPPGSPGGVGTGADTGVSMGTYVRDMADIGGSGYGVVPETPPLHPLMLGMGVPWRSALAYRLAVALYRRVGSFIAIARDASSAENRVQLNEAAAGEALRVPKVRYSVTSGDAMRVREGIKLNLRLMRGAGAAVVFPCDERAKWWIEGVHGEKEEEAFQSFVEDVDRRGIVPNATTLFSAHQMSSCRMSSESGGSDGGPVAPDGRLWECDDLYVCDGSVLPTSLGINPMITIQAVSMMLSWGIAERLGGKVDRAKAAKRGCEVLEW